MEGIKLIGHYKNGNYVVNLFSDGTKVRENDLDNLTPEFPESMDVNISNQCFGGCKYCYLGASPSGKHGSFDYKFLEDLRPYTELAININAFMIPDRFESFLERMKAKKVIVNATVNQKTIPAMSGTIDRWLKDGLLNAIGISFYQADEELFKYLEKWPNTVLHVICGLITKDDLDKLANKGVRILFLGYKQVGRGIDFYSDQIENGIIELSKSIDQRLSQFKVCSFDNLALNQLDMKSKMTSQKWDQSYMGDDGQYTMYVDLVSGTFSRNSLSNIKHEIRDNDLISMFNVIRKEECENSKKK